MYISWPAALTPLIDRCFCTSLNCYEVPPAEDVRWISPGDPTKLPWAACDVTGRAAVLKFIYGVRCSRFRDACVAETALQMVWITLHLHSFCEAAPRIGCRIMT